MTFGQKYNLDKVKRKMIFEKKVFYDILYLTYIIHSCAVNIGELWNCHNYTYGFYWKQTSGFSKVDSGILCGYGIYLFWISSNFKYYLIFKRNDLKPYR